MNNIKRISLSVIFVLCASQVPANEVLYTSSPNHTSLSQPILTADVWQEPVKIKLKSVQQKCMDYIQGNIAWTAGNDGNKNWATANLRNLCAGAVSPYVPGQCFKYVLHSPESWGKNSNHKVGWQDGIELCAGAKKLNRIKQCFKVKIANGISVRKSAQGCNQQYFDKKDSTINNTVQQKCMDSIQGNIAWTAGNDGKKNWSNTNLRKLCAGAKSPKVPGQCFKYVLHSPESWGKKSNHKIAWQDGIELCAGAEQLDRIEKCFKKKISSGNSIRESAQGCNQKYFDKKDLIADRIVHPRPQNYCTYPSAQALMRSCPTQSQIRKIRSDFNISFNNDLVDNGVLTTWDCTEGGAESSIMLTMYNTYRLAQCIPFEREFKWAPGHDNLYDWLKSVNLRNINYFWAESATSYSHASSSRRIVELIGNEMGHERYRSVINPREGVGAIHSLILLVHEAAHIAQNKGHDCAQGNDSSLAYMGAWGVQYYLNKMLALSTKDYFSEYEKAIFTGNARRIRDIRICDSD